MILVIAEKPDQGITLASPFPNKKQQGYVEILPNEIFPKGAYVTWAIGHLCQLVPPEKYEPSWKKWSLTSLPMIPNKFQYEVTKDKWKQFNIVKNLIHHEQVKQIIHAGDAGREGELIIRNILHVAKNKKPIKRLWISSMTEKAIVAGFKNLLTEQETRNLFYEAYTRACADWVVGMNASRLYSILLRQQGFDDVFSVGRVQTPTLALIVKREEEIEKFVPEPYWEVKGTFNIADKQYEGIWEKDGESRINTAQLAEKIAAFCQGKNAEVSEIEKETKEYLPPLLYNLSALQAEANRRFKYSPKKTLDILQSLYQKGFVSYPRSDSRHITVEEAKGLPSILKKINIIDDYQSLFPLPQETVIHNRRYVNEKKVTDHYAIIPTEQVPAKNKLSSEQWKIYDLIVRSVIAAHYNKSITEYVKVITLVDGRATFKSKGKVVIEEGWRKVIPQSSKEDEGKLPNLQQGEQGKVVEAIVLDKKTQPPKRYTEGQLITLMKTAGKFIDNKELEKVLMKTEGLGTEATRAGIITLLKERNYIKIEKNLVYATSKGKILIQAIGANLLTSPEMTAKWEQRLKEISEGKALPKHFMEQTSKMVHVLIENALKDAEKWQFAKKLTDNFIPQKKGKKQKLTPLGNCKKCSGKIVDKGSFYGCTNYQKEKCNFTLPKKLLNKTITQKNIKLLLEKGKTEMINGFKGKEKQFSAYLLLDEKEHKLKFQFNNEVSNNKN